MFDLNLLSVLETVMLERNVTRAAQALGMSQPAVSHALRRARALTGDALFVRVTGGVRPTPHMAAIWPKLHRALGDARDALLPAGFDPRLTHATFRLAVTESLSAHVVPAVTLALTKAAPHARLAFSVHTNDRSLDALERGTLDCAIGLFPSLPDNIRVQGLRADRYVAVMRRLHPLAADMTLAKFVAARHVLVAPSGRDHGIIDAWLSLTGLSRTIAVVVNTSTEALTIVASSDLVACVPGRVAATLTADRVDALAVAELPFDADRVFFKLAWHQRRDDDKTQRWFRDLLAKVAADP